MSTSQREVMLCGWGVTAGMACLQIKLCVAISERFRKRIWYLKALYKMSRFTYLLLMHDCLECFNNIDVVCQLRKVCQRNWIVENYE